MTTMQTQDTILNVPHMSTEEHERIVDQFGAHNYGPLPVVLAKGEGCWVTDVEGKKYLDMLGGYSALNFGALSSVHHEGRGRAGPEADLDREGLPERAVQPVLQGNHRDVRPTTWCCP
jgi:ornithine--oxo-acid transaminase